MPLQVIDLLPRLQPSVETRVRNAVLRSSAYRQAKAGEALYAQGEAADAIMLLIQGQVRAHGAGIRGGGGCVGLRGGSVAQCSGGSGSEGVRVMWASRVQGWCSVQQVWVTAGCWGFGRALNLATFP